MNGLRPETGRRWQRLHGQESHGQDQRRPHDRHHFDHDLSRTVSRGLLWTRFRAVRFLDSGDPMMIRPMQEQVPGGR